MPINEKLDEKSGKLYFDVYVCIASKINPAIRVQRRKTKITSKNIALKIERDLYQECGKALHLEENRGHSWGSIVNQWYKYETSNKLSPIGKDTLEDYFNSLKIWTKPFWDKPAFQLSKSEIKNVLGRLEEADRSKSYQAKMKQTINKVFTWGMDEGKIKNVTLSPTTGIQVNRKTEKTPEMLTMPQVQKFLEIAKESDHPWYPVWCMALSSGCRNGELYALVWDDVNFDSNNICVSKSYNTRTRSIKSTKAGYWRNVPINEELRSLLLELKNEAKGRAEVLPRLPNWNKGCQAKELRTFLTSINLPSVKFHTLRACFATMMLQLNTPAPKVMKICGWRDLDTMAKYLRLSAIDEAGATDVLHILPKVACENVIELLQRS